jgi:4-diphosphocytidyl-2-C-methyl-D-erythritol kinase
VNPVGTSVRALAPAKVNLFLEILGRRPDGYHDVRTWMLAVDVFDEVRARTTKDAQIALSIGGPQAGSDVRPDGTNLVFRAARACLEAAREAGLVDADAGLDLHLEKHIPSQAGLGGASADAAAAWIAARAALGIELEDATGEAHLAQLGSDCVFFLKASRTGFACCEGRGDRVSGARPFPRLSIALVTPALAIPTARVYAAFAARARAGPETWPTWDGSVTSVRDLRHRLRNDLEPAAREVAPELGAWRDLLAACGADHFRLSGSGSSFFGLFDEDRAAQDALARVREEARARALGVRLLVVAHPAGHGSELALDT